MEYVDKLFDPAVQAVAYAILGGVALTQAWKLWRKDQTGSKPRNWLTVIVSVFVTGALSMAITWADGASVKMALAQALKVGPASPILWLIIQWAARRWAPGLAEKIGESRRAAPRDDEPAWTDDERARKREMFEDTTIIRKRD